MVESLQDIENIFFNFFNSRNYVFHPAIDLISDDDSVYFTNSTIVPLKNELVNSLLPSEGVVIKQPCLRLKCLNDSISFYSSLETSFERFIGSFLMLGTFVNSSKNIELQNDISSLLLDFYKIPSSDIKIYSSKSFNFTSVFENELNVDFDSQPSSFYSWKYGLYGLNGKGATFSLKQKNFSFKEIGQLVELTYNNKIIGYEFGFGVETFLSRKNKILSYDVWPISKFIPEGLRFKTFIDLFSCFGAVCTSPVEKLSKKHHKEIRRLARRIIQLESTFSVSRNDSLFYLDSFVKDQFNRYDLKPVFSDYLSSAKKTVIKDELNYKSFLKKLKKQGYSYIDAKEKSKDLSYLKSGLSIDSKNFILNEVYE